MKKLNKYTARLFAKLLELFSIYEMTADQETLHKIRINIKKIRSIFRLIGYCDKKFNDRKQFRPFKKIFNEAGVIRSIYIADKLMNEFQMYNETERINGSSGNEIRMDHISSFIKNTKRNINVVYKKFFEIEKNMEGISSKCFDKYCQIKHLELRKLIYPDLIEAKLHNARRICKEITFLNDIDRNTNTDKVLFFDKLQDMIGEWHDKVELLKKIKNDNRDNANRKVEDLKIDIETELSSIKNLVNTIYMI